MGESLVGLSGASLVALYAAIHAAIVIHGYAVVHHQLRLPQGANALNRVSYACDGEEDSIQLLARPS